MHLPSLMLTRMFFLSAKSPCRISSRLEFPATGRRRWGEAMFLWACAALLLIGCGGKSGYGGGSSYSQSVVITVQPLSQTVPLGEMATFAVTATGTPPLSYQWSENGTEIPGATSASYTTPAIALGENGSTSIGSFQVTVSNANSRATSNSVTLSAGPRSPKPGDLRYLVFEQVDIPGLSQDGGIATVLSADDISYPDSVGSPLSIGPDDCYPPGTDCAWQIYMFQLPPPMTGLNMYYQSGNYPDFTSDMQSILAPDVVLSSLDLEPANGAYAVATVQTTHSGGFDYRQETVPLGANLQAGIQNQAAQDGAGSRIITAVTFDDQLQKAVLLSYGWTGDTTTVYETQTIVATSENVVSAAITLAGQGYAISAFGGNGTDGYMLIGTRVKGDTLARQICVFLPDSTTSSTPCVDNGVYYTPVVKLLDNSGSTDITEQ